MLPKSVKASIWLAQYLVNYDENALNIIKIFVITLTELYRNIRLALCV
jgi:hypothetical protein